MQNTILSRLQHYCNSKSAQCDFLAVKYGLPLCLMHRFQRRHKGAERGGGTAPCDTLQRVTPEGKNFLWANLQRIAEKRGRTGKKR